MGALGETGGLAAERRAARRLAALLRKVDEYRRARGMAFVGIADSIADPEMRTVAQDAVEHLRRMADEARAEAARELARLAMDMGLDRAVEALQNLDAESGVDDGVDAETAALRIVREVLEEREEGEAP